MNRTFNVVSLHTLVKRVKVGFVGTCERYYCSENDGFPIIRTTDLIENGINFSSLKYITKEFYDKEKKSQLNQGDLLIARHGDNGKAKIYKKKFPAQALNVVIIEPNQEKISSYLLKCFFETSFVKIQILNSCGGSVQSVVNTKIINNLLIPLYSCINYNNISELLENLEYKIELNNQINQNLEAMAKTLYDYWFVQFDFPNANGKPYKSSGGKMVYSEELKREIPEGWGVLELSEVIKLDRGISYKSSDITDNGTPMINLNSFYLNGSYKHKGIKYFSSNYNENKIVSANDLLIATTDVTRDADIIGKAILVPNIFDNDILMSCDIARVTVTDKIDKYYLEMLFNSDYYHKYIKGFASGTLVLHLNMSGIGWFKIIVPPKDLLNKFSDLKKNIEKKKNIILKETQKLTQLRDWLLPMLMNGQVTVGRGILTPTV